MNRDALSLNSPAAHPSHDGSVVKKCGVDRVSSRASAGAEICVLNPPRLVSAFFFLLVASSLFFFDVHPSLVTLEVT
jgi:hypothetical protein